MVRFLWLPCRYKNEQSSGKIKRMEGMFLREISVNFIVIGQRH